MANKETEIDRRRTVTFNLEGLEPTFDKVRAELSLNIQTVRLTRPLISAEVQKEIMEQSGLTLAEIEDASERMFEHLEMIALTKFLLKRRVRS